MKRESLDDLTGLSRQRRWQLRRIEAGLCQICGRPRTAKGSDTRCAKHARINRAYHQKAKAA
jgi:hypothetical protein